MAVAHYIIFHPEKKRVEIQVKAVALTQNNVNLEWPGSVWVDKPNGNEDPFVFFEPWLFSYCHATQLRREQRDSSYIQPGSHLMFCSGDSADEGNLLIDTVFVVDRVAKWQWGKSPDLPEEFKKYKNDKDSALWMRHLRFGIGKDEQHTGRYTYVSCMWQKGATRFSFLPLNASGRRTRFPVDVLPQALRKSVTRGIKGKRPVLLEDPQIKAVLDLVEKFTATKIVRIIGPAGETPVSGKTDLRCC